MNTGFLNYLQLISQRGNVALTAQALRESLHWQAPTATQDTLKFLFWTMKINSGISFLVVLYFPHRVPNLMARYG